jgi:hypothetical protein
MTKAFLDGIHGFVAARGLELISLARGRRKDDIAHEFLTRFTDQEGLLCVGRPGEGGPVAHPTPPQRRDRRRLRPVVPWCPWRSLLIIDLGITIVWAQAMYLSEPA